jgi:hypothetical protein
MSNAYIIEVGSHTAGIVARDERSYRFFSSDRIFDSLGGAANFAPRATPSVRRERCSWSGVIWSADNCSPRSDWSSNTY